MTIAGLTGGIASGKTTVSLILKQAGAKIVDADAIAHAVVRKGLPAWEKLVAHFGRKILLPSGEINRPSLADIVFNNPNQKEILNRIVHPFVFEETDRQVREIQRENPLSVIIQDIPLLIESGMYTRFSEIILVYVPEVLQLQRLMARNGFSENQAMLRIRSQMPIEDKKRFATMIVDNSRNMEDTRQQTLVVYEKLLTISRRTICPPCDRYHP